MRITLKKLMLCFIATFFLILIAGETKGLASSGSVIHEYVYVTDYEVTNEAIVPGEEFTLKMTIKNFSGVATAQRITVTVNNPTGVIPEYGTVSQTYIDRILPEGSMELSYKYTADSTIQGTSLNFTVDIVTGLFAGQSQLRIPVGRTSDFETENVYLPEIITKSQPEYMSATVRNLTGKKVNDVALVVRCDGVDIAFANIGTIAADNKKSQSVSASINKAGQYNLELVLTYENNEGESKEYLLSSGIVTVNEEGKDMEQTGQAEDEKKGFLDVINGSGNSTVVIICMGGIFLIIICCLILMLIYKRK